MPTQLRRYQVAPGRMDAFVALWRDQVVPARLAYGFRVVAAWVDREADQFGWLVTHDGDFAGADRSYYASPERAAIDPDPGSFLEKVETSMVEPVERP